MAVDSAVVERDEPPLLSLEVEAVTCDSTDNGQITPTVSEGTPPYRFEWSTGDTSSILGGLKPGTYSLTVTDANACTVSAEATVGRDTLELSFTTVSAVCEDIESGSATVNATGGDEPYTYLWNTGDTTAIIVDVAPGAYAVTVMDVKGCATTDSVAVDVEPFDINVPSPLASCFGESLSLNPDGNPGFVYNWSPADDLDDPMSFNPSLVVTESQTFSVTIMDSTGVCEAIRMVEVNVEEINLEVSPDTLLCEAGQRITLLATSEEAVRYHWFRVPDFSNAISNAPFIRVSEGTFVVEAESAAGCTAVDTVNVELRAIDVELPPLDTVVCEDEPVELGIINRNPEDMLSFQWTPDDPEIIDDPTSDMPIVRPSASTTFEVTIQNQFGCTTTEEIFVEVSVIDDVELSANPEVIIKPETSEISATFNPNYTYEWSPAETLSDPFINNPIASPIETTTYSVTVTNELGCEFMDEIELEVDTLPCERPFLFLPNAFSPNGDGMNDILYVRGQHVEAILRFEIYNRLGELVFKFAEDVDAENFQPEDPNFGWNGRFRNTGDFVSGDVFGYVLQVKCLCLEEPFSEQGNITVIR